MRMLVVGCLGCVLLTLDRLPASGQNASDVEKLLAQLQAKDPGQRQVAAPELNKLGPEAGAAVPPLLEALKDNNAEVRQTATNVLGKIGKTAVPGLMKALQDENRLVRRQASIALAKVGPDARPAVPALSTTLTDQD